VPVLDNPRHELFAAKLAKGLTQTQAAIEAGYTPKAAEVTGSRLASNVKIKARRDELRVRIVEKTTFDAAKLLDRCAELVDLTVEDFKTIPRDQWTPAMKRWACDEEPVMMRSQDGEQKGDSKSWDQVGTRVKIRVSDKLKALEMIAKHKTVDAFVSQKPGDINIVVITAERARQIGTAIKRLEAYDASIIETTAEPQDVVDR
jgi:phage terminase small subunit